MIPFLSEIINAVVIGSLYSLMALPLTLSYRIVKFPNFAHTFLITMGAYAAIFVSLPFSTSVFVLVPVSFAAGAILATFNHLLVYAPLIRRGATPLTLMIASLGSSTLLKYVLYSVIDVSRRLWKVELYYLLPNVPMGEPFVIGDFYVSQIFVLSVAIAITLFVSLQLFLLKSRIGRAIRAVADNADLAELSGISKDRMMIVMWIIAGGITAIAGLFWCFFTRSSPEMGDAVILSVFASSVIGGLQSFLGTVSGAYIIAFSENVLIAALHNVLGLDVSFRPFISFLTLVVVLLVRPPAGVSLTARTVFGRKRKK